jgi:hypothetical protein
MDSGCRWLLLINSRVLLILCVLVGRGLCQKVNLRVPLIEKWIGIPKGPMKLAEILTWKMAGGMVKPTFAPRLLYGGITEEIFLRFGWMTLIVWVGSKISKQTKPAIDWMEIVLSALLFAIGHLPVVYHTLEVPSTTLLTYVLLGNTMGGLIILLPIGLHQIQSLKNSVHSSHCQWNCIKLW